jgi:hypothetical protein
MHVRELDEVDTPPSLPLARVWRRQLCQLRWIGDPPSKVTAIAAFCEGRMRRARPSDMNFVNFQLEQPSGSGASVEEPATAGRPAPKVTGPTSRDSLA